MPYSDPEEALRQRRLWREKNRENIRQKHKVWRDANKEQRKVKEAVWKAANPEKVQSAKAKWRANNKDVIRALGRAHYEANKDAVLKYSREWRRENKEKVALTTKQWAEANRDKRSANQNKRRATKASAPGRYTSDDILEMFGEQDGLCECGADLLLGYHVDHKTPLSRGGSNWPDNLQLLCPSCNCRKHAKTELEWQLAKYKETLK